MQQDAPPLGGNIISAFKKVFKHQLSIPDVAEDHFIIEVQGRIEESVEEDSEST